MTRSLLVPVPPLVAVLAALAASPTASRGQDRPVALSGAAIETVGEAGRIESGAIVLRDGKIEAVGPAGEVEIPGDARVEDARGRTIMPGIVEPAYPYRAPGDPSASAPRRVLIIGGRVITLGGSSPTRPATFTRVADLFDPFRSDFAPLLRSGLTHLDLVPPDYGQAAVVRITPEDPDGMVVARDGRLFASVSNSTASLDVVRKGLEGASRPAGDRPRGPGGPGPGRPGGPPSRPAGGPEAPAPSSSGPPSANDAARDLWKAVAEGKAPLIAEAANAAAILYLLEALEEHKDVKLGLIASGADAYRALDRLAGRPGLTVLLRPTVDTKPDNEDLINVPRALHERGIPIVFTRGGFGGPPSAQDAPLFDVGYLVATGLPRAEALAALTARPADLIGQGEALGRLETGKAASLLVFDGDPLDPYSRLRTVIIAGRTVYEAD